MNPNTPETIYTKTAKGILEIRNKTVKLPRELGLVFLSVDGKITVGELLPRSGMTAPQFQHALATLVTDGYIKVVSTQPSAPVQDAMELDFTSPQATAQLNMEAASRSLAESEANKRAQQESRAATNARLRQEAEGGARALAEARAEAEAEARAKAEEAARVAVEERAQAEREVAQATDPAMRTQAEARVRAASAAAARAEAEARVRGEAEARARALANEKKAAEDEARTEAEARARAEEQAQARAAAEARAREAVEAQIQAMQGALAYADDPQAPEGDVARARVRELEQEADRAREEARAIAQAEGRAHEAPQPELDIADRVRQLNARVQSARHSREGADRATRDALNVESKAASDQHQEGAWPSLQLGRDSDQGLPALEPNIVVPIPLETSPVRQDVSFTDAVTETDLPGLDLDRADTPLPLPPHPEQHVQSALERAMTQAGARAKKDEQPKVMPPAAAPSSAIAEWTAPLDLAPDPEPTFARAPAPAAEPSENDPTIEETEPTREKFGIDRAAHDIIAESSEARRQADAAQVGRSAALARQKKKEDEARREGVFERTRKRKQAMIGGGIALAVVIAGTVAWFQFTPLNGYIPGAQQALSARLNQPVRISSLRYVFLPTPRLVLEGVAIGKQEGVRANRVEAHALPFGLYGDPKRFGTVEAQGVTIEPSMLGTIPAWTGGRSAASVHVDRLRLSEVKLDIPKSELGAFNGEVEFAPNGTLKRAVFSNETMRLELAPQNDGVRATFEASNWKLPFVPALEFDRITLKGALNPEMSASEYTGRFASGALQGTLNAQWAGPIIVEGEFKLENAQLRDLARALAPDLEAKGTVKASGRYTLQGETAAALLANAQAEINFSIVRGELSNIDLMRGIQSPGAAAFRGGRTGFEELSGALQITNGRYVYRQVQLTSGPLNATATIDVSPGGALSGRLNAELATKGGVAARQALAVGGTVKDPQLRR